MAKKGDVLRDPVTREEVIDLLAEIVDADREDYIDLRPVLANAAVEMLDRLRAEREVALHVGEPDTFQAPAVTSARAALSTTLDGAHREMQRLVDELKAKEDETQAVIRAAQAEADKKAKEALAEKLQEHQRKLTASRHALEQILGDIEVACDERPIPPHHSSWHTLVDNGGMQAFFDDWKKWGDRVVGICKNGMGRLGRSGI